MARKHIVARKHTCWVLLCGVLFMFLFACPSHTGAAEEYRFERMWPTLQQPWYFFGPLGVASCNDFVYVADTDNNRIQIFTSEGHIVSKFGKDGTGDGEFQSPGGVAVDTDGNIYVADTENHRIQKFSSEGRFIIKWGHEGTGDSEFKSPSGVAVDSAGNVYVSDTLNHRLQKFDSAGQFVATWGTSGAENGQLNRPIGLALDGVGNVYVADSLNHRIEKFSSSGQFLNAWGIPGTGTGQFNQPAGVAVDTNGSLFVADTNNHRVQKLSASGQFLASWGTQGGTSEGFYFPGGIALGSDGGLLVADTYNSRIQKLSADGRFLAYWGCQGADPGMFDYPSGIDADASNNIFVVDTYNNRVQVFTADGQLVDEWGNQGNGPGDFNEPYGIAVSGTGNVYVADSLNHRIQKFSSDGQFLTSLGTPGTSNSQFNRPVGVALDANGNLYVTDSLNHRIQKFTAGGQFSAAWGHQGTGNGEFNEPVGIALDASGNVYVVDRGNNRVQQFSSGGQFLTGWGSAGDGDGEFSEPSGIEVDSSGNIIVADQGNHRFQVFSGTGQFISVWGRFGSDPGDFNNPYALALGSSGQVYVADSANQRIQLFLATSAPTPGQRRDKAIIVAGGGAFAGNNIWDATQVCANFAYRTLTYQGFSGDAIHYLSSNTTLDLSGDRVPDVDGAATNANLQAAIGTWAQDAQNLLVYLVDHGGNGSFRMGATELLQATDLDSWLDSIQAAIPGTVTLIYDACRSGSFLPLVTPPTGKTRILLTSTSSDEEAIFCSQGTISFSFLFWARMFNGDSLYDAFVQAKNAILSTYNQNPLLDGNGNGIGNERPDQEAARALRIGNETRTGADLPTIGSISPAQTLSGQTSAVLYADSVVDADGIQQVWAVITPPGYSPGSADSPVTDLPSLELSPVGSNRYQGTYTGFTQNGTYNIAAYAMDGEGILSLPQQTSVTQQAGGGLAALYFPHIASNTTWETEIAVINPSSADTLTGTLKPYRDSGQEVSARLPLSIAPHGRREIVIGESFASPSDIGYLILEATGGTAKGYTKFYQEGICRVGIPAVAASDSNTNDIYLTHVTANPSWWTGVSLLNTGSQARNITIDFNDGTSASRSLAANEHQKFLVSSLFSGQTPAGISSAVIRNGSGVIGLELFSSANQVEGIPLTDDTASRVYYPHVTSSATWWTGIVAYNPSTSPCALLITPYAADGAALTPIPRMLNGKEKYLGLPNDLGLPQETAWFYIDATSPITGFELIGTTDWNQVGGFYGIGANKKDGIFAKIERGGWTYLVLTNTEDTQAHVTITAYDDSGTQVAVTTFTLNAHAKVAQTAEEFFANQNITTATYLTYSSDKDLVGLQLNGSADSTMLDGLPGL
jgi:sugar lactone lactonase YvrE